MKITTPNGTLVGDSIEAILEEYGRDCLSYANLSWADLSGANLSGANLSHADLIWAKLPEPTIAQTSTLQD